MRRVGKNSIGFTIVELLIATTVFSAVLLVALTGFFQIGQLYYKAVNMSHTQQVAQQTLNDMSSAVQFATTIHLPQSVDPSNTNESRQYMCLGNTRYTYILGHQVDPSDNKIDAFGLLRDTLSGSAGCASPFGPASTPLHDPVELLGNKMRLSNFCLLQASVNNLNTSTCQNDPNSLLVNLWVIGLKISYGDDDILDNATKTDASCNKNLKTSQLCAVVDLQTTVSRGH